MNTGTDECQFNRLFRQTKKGRYDIKKQQHRIAAVSESKGGFASVDTFFTFDHHLFDANQTTRLLQTVGLSILHLATNLHVLSFRLCY